MFRPILIASALQLVHFDTTVGDDGVSSRWMPKTIPTWSSTYVVRGVISIPYAEIHEPFTAYFDGPNQRSRIDYYHGMDKTYQRADIGRYGTMFKVVPMTTDVVKNQINCFQVDGLAGEGGAVHVQSVLPDMSGYKFHRLIKDENYGKLEVWHSRISYQGDNSTRLADKTSLYTVILRRVISPLNKELQTFVPIKFEMRGYNVLLGSHFDHYYVEYEDFIDEMPDKIVFDDYAKFGPCHGMPGPGDSHAKAYEMNPMVEFIPATGHQDHVVSAYETFKIHHRTNNRPGVEGNYDDFVHNMRYIYSSNRRRGVSTLVKPPTSPTSTMVLKPNHMSDWSPMQFRYRRGKIFTNVKYNGGLEFVSDQADVDQLPDNLDWFLRGAVTPVKDQAMCGSCWAFGTVGTLEGAYYLKTGNLIPLSEQSLVDCSWGYANNGCDGGEDFRAYQYMMHNGGIPSTEDYGPYLGQDGECRRTKDHPEIKPTMEISHFVNVTPGDATALRVALHKFGPISVAIDAGHKSLAFYSHGIYNEPECKNGPEDLDHAVLAIGYGADENTGRKYWLVKNSWSTYWGLGGYFLLDADAVNHCGILTMPTYVVPK